MTELRKQFEGLENVKDKLKWVYFCNEKYFERELEYRSSAIWMNGAWWAYQEQQKPIKDLKDGLTDIWTNLDDRQSKEWIIEHCENIIKELLK